MADSKRILVAHQNDDARAVIAGAVRELGHEVVAELETGQQIIDWCLDARPDIAIAGVEMPEIDGIEALIKVGEVDPLPAIIVTPNADIDLVERAVQDHVMAYLVEPVTKKDLMPAIHLVVLRYEQFQALRDQVKDLSQALEARKVIEKAKGILMRRGDIDEDQAFRRLQKLASSERKRVVEVAQAILTSEKALS